MAVLLNTTQSSYLSNNLHKIISHIPTQNYTFNISNSSIISSSQNTFGTITPASAMHILSMAFAVLFPLLIVIIILFLMIGYITNSKNIKQTALDHMRDFLFIIILAAIVNAFGFDVFYKILHIGYFFTQDFKMYHQISHIFLGIWLSTISTEMIIKGVEGYLVAWAGIPGVDYVVAGLSASLQVGVTALISLLSTIITFSFDGFKITWIVIFLLSFAQVVSITYLLPIGIVFRAFSLTKTVGAGFISLAIGLGFIFPIVTYIFTSVAFYIKNNFVIQTKLGPMTITQIGHQSIHINNIHLFYLFIGVATGGIGVMNYIFLFFQNIVIYTIFVFMIGTLVPGLSVLMTIISIAGMTSYFGGTGMGLPRIKI